MTGKKAEHKRSIAKAFTWRVCATLTTVILVWIFVGNPMIALSVGFFEVIVKILVYYLHERAWNLTGWGLQDG